MNTPNEKVGILGAGLVGSLLSLYLKRRGYDVELYERRGDMRRHGYVGGRSINLAMSERGWNALRAVGIADEIFKVGLPMSGRLMHNLDGTETYQPYGKEGQAIFSVSRGALNQKLVEMAEAEGVKIRFDYRATQVDLNNGVAQVVQTGSLIPQMVPKDIWFGADGSGSAMRMAMQVQDRFEYSQTYIDHGYKEFEIKPNADGSWKMRHDVLHIWARGNFMMIALPNPGGDFTLTLFFPWHGPLSFAAIQTDAQIQHFFSEYFPDLQQLMPDYVQQFKEHVTSSLVTVKCGPWVNGKCALIGDAAHAIVPFYGQGMNCGFEDVFQLDQYLAQGATLTEVLGPWAAARKPNADAIAELAMINFVEMRDKVNDQRFLLQKKIEAQFATLYPDKWLPMYSQVTFTNTPYAQALANGLQQDKLMQPILDLPHAEQIPNDGELVKQIWEAHISK